MKCQVICVAGNGDTKLLTERILEFVKYETVDLRQGHHEKVAYGVLSFHNLLPTFIISPTISIVDLGHLAE